MATAVVLSVLEIPFALLLGVFAGLVFANGTGGPLEAQNVVNRHFKPLLQRAGLPAIRFHDLRHSCLSLLAQRGEPIRDLQALVGHATAAFSASRP